MKKIERVAAYVRVSSQEQVLHGLSLDAQRMKLNEYAETINPILLFFAEIGDDMLDKPTKWGFNQYEQFCIDNRLKAVSHIEFSKQVKEQLKYKIKDVRIDGKVRKVFKR